MGIISWNPLTRCRPWKVNSRPLRQRLRTLPVTMISPAPARLQIRAARLTLVPYRSVSLGYDIAGIDANADLERILRGGFVLFDQFPLDRYRRCHGRIALGEYGEHAVSGLLDDGSTKFANDRSNDVIMEFDDLVSRVIAKLIENFR